MPSVYEDPGAHGLVPLGKLNELHIYEDVFCFNWHIAVWQDEDWSDHLYYAFESNGGAKFTQAPFERFTKRSMLTYIATPADYEAFKCRLNFYRLGPNERHERNLRTRLQQKVGRRFYSEPAM